MGHGHCFEALLSAAKRLLDGGSPIEIVMTGGGVQALRIQQRIKDEQLTNIDFKGYVSSRELRDIQSHSHCAIITLKDSMLGCMSPSKLHAILAMGVPVFYMGPAGSSVDRAIAEYGCGESIRNEDIDHFIDRLELLSRSPELQQQYSRSARRAFEDRYCDKTNWPLFDAVIEGNDTEKTIAGLGQRAA